jgi:hypothetical protein
MEESSLVATEESSMTPHRCPVCAGRGTVPAGFYSPYGSGTNATPETCRSCNGGGVVWSGGTLPQMIDGPVFRTPPVKLDWPSPTLEVEERVYVKREEPSERANGERFPRD